MDEVSRGAAETSEVEKPMAVWRLEEPNHKQFGVKINGGVQARERKMGEELLPGIPDTITLSKIVTKLPWRAFHILLISRAWLDAVRSHRVYAERVHSKSTETLAIVSYYHPSVGIFFALYSMRDNSFVKLPPIPNFSEKMRGSFECVSLEGKIYVLGGELYSDSVFDELSSDAVYVFDLVGLRQWKRCASMTRPRLKFGCAVMDGKIYVFGGKSSKERFRGSEVYDPKENSWSRITSMRSLRLRNTVETMGKELLLLGGNRVYRNYLSPAANRSADRMWASHIDFHEVYNPVNDEWRVLERLLWDLPTRGRQFVASGKLHSINYVMDKENSIHIHDEEKKSWTLVHSFSPPEDWPDIKSRTVRSVQLVDDELLAAVHYVARGGGSTQYLLQSKGFGRESEEIVWNIVQFPLLPAEVYNPVNDMWRVLNRLLSDLPTRGPQFVASRKLHSVNDVMDKKNSIHIHDEEENSWTLMHSFLPPEDWPDTESRVWSVKLVDDEIVAGVHYIARGGGNTNYFLQSKGFGGESEEIVWNIEQFPLLPAEGLLGNRPCPIQL